MNSSEEVPIPLHSLYLVAIVAEAKTAALAAGRRSMDWIGVSQLDFPVDILPIDFG